MQEFLIGKTRSVMSLHSGKRGMFSIYPSTTVQSKEEEEEEEEGYTSESSLSILDVRFTFFTFQASSRC
jgi:hypothetical protein